MTEPVHTPTNGIQLGERKAGIGKSITYKVSVLGERKKPLGKGRMMLLIISRVLKKGVAPEEVEETLGRRGLFQALDGKLGTEEIQKN